MSLIIPAFACEILRNRIRIRVGWLLCLRMSRGYDPIASCKRFEFAICAFDLAFLSWVWGVICQWCTGCALRDYFPTLQCCFLFLVLLFHHIILLYSCLYEMHARVYLCGCHSMMNKDYICILGIN